LLYASKIPPNLWNKLRQRKEDRQAFDHLTSLQNLVLQQVSDDQTEHYLNEQRKQTHQTDAINWTNTVKTGGHIEGNTYCHKCQSTTHFTAQCTSTTATSKSS